MLVQIIDSSILWVSAKSSSSVHDTWKMDTARPSVCFLSYCPIIQPKTNTAIHSFLHSLNNPPSIDTGVMIGLVGHILVCHRWQIGSRFQIFITNMVMMQIWRQKLVMCINTCVGISMKIKIAMFVFCIRISICPSNSYWTVARVHVTAGRHYMPTNSSKHMGTYHMILVRVMWHAPMIPMRDSVHSSIQLVTKWTLAEHVRGIIKVELEHVQRYVLMAYHWETVYCTIVEQLNFSLHETTIIILQSYNWSQSASSGHPFIRSSLTCYMLRINLLFYSLADRRVSQRHGCRVWILWLHE